MHDKAKEFYVIIVHPEGPMVLMLDRYDLAGARQAIAWQRTGGFQQPMHICRYDADAKNFVDEDGNRFAPVQPPVTDTAWNEFLARLGAEDGFTDPRSTLERMRALLATDDREDFLEACRLLAAVEDDQELAEIKREFLGIGDYDAQGNHVGAVRNENGWTP